MAVFEYTALDIKGKKQSGIIDVESLAAGREKLRQRDFFPISLNRIESGNSGKKGLSPGSLKADMLSSLFSGVKSSDVTMVVRQLATLLSAGFPIVKAFATLVPQVRSKAFQRVLSRAKDAIEEGSSVADALAKHPGVFPPVFISMVKAGESSGTLEIVLERLADFSEKKEDTKKKIQAALAYPLFMAVIGALVLFFLLTYIVPGITKIFTDLNQTLPLPTRLLLNTSDFLTQYWWAVLLIPVFVSAGFLIVKRTGRGRLFIDGITLSLPVAGGLIRKMIAARFSRTLGSLLENGVPMMTALEISKSISGNIVVSQAIEKAAHSVEQGGSISHVFETNRIFPDLATQMIKVGEKSGEIERMLEKSADLFDRDVNNAVTAATSIVEPLIILVMGVVIAFIILAICLPIFEINQMIG